MIESTAFNERQNRLLEKVEEGIFLFPSADYVTKSHDTEFPFRQNSHFKYLLGFNEPNCLLIMKKDLEGKKETLLFLREKDPFMEMWAGERTGTKKAIDLLSIDQAYDITQLKEKLPDLFAGHKNLYFDLQNTKLSGIVKSATASLNAQRKRKVHKPNSWHDSSNAIGMLRLHKDQNEILAMKKAAALTNTAHRAAMAMATPGVNEKDINTLFDFIFSQGDGAGSAYDSIIAGGRNALTLHYISNNKDLKNGDLLLIDAGAQVNLYASDVTRTFPVNGQFTSAQKEIYSLVLNAQKTALAFAKPGVSLKDIHLETCRSLSKGMLELGVLKGSLDEVMEKESYKTYYPHGTGHWLGLDVHDQSPYLDDNLEEIKLAPGMTFTCEPGLYFPEHDSNIPDSFKGIGIRIEDDIHVTTSGLENLTSSIPKELKEVEEACQRDLNSVLSGSTFLPL